MKKKLQSGALGEKVSAVAFARGSESMWIMINRLVHLSSAEI